LSCFSGRIVHGREEPGASGRSPRPDDDIIIEIGMALTEENHFASDAKTEALGQSAGVRGDRRVQSLDVTPLPSNLVRDELNLDG